MLLNIRTMSIKLQNINKIENILNKKYDLYNYF